MTHRAPGKAILIGEHAVVHGYAAIAVPAEAAAVEVIIDTAGRWLWEGDDAGSDRVASPDDGTDAGEMLGDLCNALVDALYEVGVDAVPPIGVRVRGGVRAGGMGTSAALCTALTRALLAQAGAELPEHVLARVANAGERIFHGTPSGIDAAAAAYGRPILFRKGSEPRPLRVAAPVYLVPAASRARSSTKEAVAMVTAAKEAGGEAAERLAAMGSLAERAAEALAAGDRAALADCMNAAQEHLAALGLGHEATAALRAAAMEAGAEAAKITGAGCGGSILALAADAASAQRIAEELRRHPDCGHCFVITLHPSDGPGELPERPAGPDSASSP